MDELEILRRARPTVPPSSPEAFRTGRAVLAAVMVEEGGAQRNGTAWRQRRRRSLAWVGAATAAAIAALMFGVGPFLSPPAAATPVEIVTSERYVEVRFVDLSANEEDIVTAIRDAGIDISVGLVPVSPSLVGELVKVGSDALPDGTWEFLNPSASGGPPTVRLARDSAGGLEITIGRLATGDEVFVVAADDAELPGELLHCANIVLSTGRHAADVAAERGITVRWLDAATQRILFFPLPDRFRNRYVVSARPTGPSVVAIELSIDEPTDARPPSYLETLGANCPRGKTET